MKLQGLKINNNILSINPCISKEWKEYNIKYKYGESIYNITVKNPYGRNTGVSKVILNGEEVENQIKLDRTGKVFNVEVEM